MATNQEFAAALRALADLYESDERMLQPADGLEIYLGFLRKEALVDAIKALSAGGTVEKVEPRDKNDFFRLFRRDFAGVSVKLSVPRDVICKRVQKLELVETWDCSESLLDAETE